jgi:threonine synthase
MDDVVLIRCSSCQQPYPDNGLPYRCDRCGGVYDAPVLPDFLASSQDDSQPGIFHYRGMLGLPPDCVPVSLGEGGTPLVWGQTPAGGAAFKLEFMNPSASYKDRGSAVLATMLRARKVREAIEDSSGNAGASFAAYAGYGGIRAHIFVPAYAAGPKRLQIERYGAEIEPVPGPRTQTSTAVQRAAQDGAVYASHAYSPFTLFGYATIAYELVAQMGGAPGTVIAPTGQGNLLLAIGRGFQALQRAGLIARIPALVGVQARACSPLWAAFHYGAAGLQWVSEGETLAEGVRIRYPVRGDALIQLLRDSGGTMLAVDEPEILPGRDALAQQGLYVEPTSAIVWSALAQIGSQFPKPLAVILTGSGLKSLD